MSSRGFDKPIDLIQAVTKVNLGLVVLEAIIKLLKMEREPMLGGVRVNSFRSEQSTVENKRIGNCKTCR